MKIYKLCYKRRVILSLQEIIYKEEISVETKRKVKCKEVTFTLDSPQQFRKNYDEFLALVNKHCKDIVEMNESRYEHAKNLTKPITPVDKKNLQNYKKQKEKETKRRPEDIIEG